jgi:hypothetical protein
MDNVVDRSSRPDIPGEIIAYHLVSAHIGLGMWWIENNKPYPLEYLTQISMCLSLAGMLRSMGVEQMSLPLPKRPLKE